ncbi:hypothetical protein ZWY2020_039726 [Hordeum vulgare]|nr:hypothetical protein ZWY2020_039726 [Hordeum vulgare]
MTGGGGDITEKHGLKSVFALTASSCSVAIHSTPRNGRSLLPYAADSTIFLDGEPKSPFFAPIPKEQYDAHSINHSRHLEMYLDSTNDDFESLLSEIEKEISMADIVIE